MNNEKIDAIIAMLEEEIEKIDNIIKKILSKKSNITFIESKLIEEFIRVKMELCFRIEDMNSVKNLELKYINEDFTFKNTDIMIESYIETINKRATIK